MADPLYHVTFSKSLPDIQERGLDPLSGSLWRQAGTGDRYQDQPSVFSFQDPEEALRWASKMEWEFRDDISGPSDISIIKLRGGDKWESDPAAGGPDIGKTSMRSLGHIPSSDILDIMGLPSGAGINEEFQRQVPGGMVDEWLKFYGDRLRSSGSIADTPADYDDFIGWIANEYRDGAVQSSFTEDQLNAGEHYIEANRMADEQTDSYGVGFRDALIAEYNAARGAVPDEPRPPEQSNLPAVLEAASAASQLLGQRGESRPKGKLQGGIGALRKAPWFALARMAWNELSPEQRGAAEDYAKQAYGSLEAGIDAAQEWTGRQNFPEGFAGGLEWAKDALGFGDQEPSGIMSLPDLQKYRSLFHGGPYQWAPEPGYPEGRARLDKQGTGEGVAAYGWGAYLAEAPGVATDYKVRLVDRTGYQTLEDNTKIPSWVANKVNAGQADEVRQDFLSRIAEADRKVAAKEGQYWLEEQKIEGLREVVSAIDKMVGGQTASSGALYQLDIPEADTDRLLDYDAPLSEQPKILNKIFSITGKTADELKALDVNFEALSERLLEYKYGTKQRQALQAEWDAALSDPQRKIGSVLARMDRPIGTFGYDAASQQTGGALISALGKTQETSEFLRKADIPGLKYLDQGSRSGANVDIIINGTSAKDLSSVEQMAAERVADAVYRLKSEGKPHGANESVKSAFTTIVNDIGLMGNFSDEAQALKSARSWEYIRLLEEWASDPGSVELKDTTTRNYVVWDQDLLDRLKTVRKEARGGFIDKPLYDQPRMLG